MHSTNLTESKTGLPEELQNFINLFLSTDEKNDIYTIADVDVNLIVK